MSTAAKLVASTETTKDTRTLPAVNGVKESKATAKSYSAQKEAERRKWGVETSAVRSIHARKF